MLLESFYRYDEDLTEKIRSFCVGRYLDGVLQFYKMTGSVDYLAIFNWIGTGMMGEERECQKEGTNEGKEKTARDEDGSVDCVPGQVHVDNDVMDLVRLGPLLSLPEFDGDVEETGNGAVDMVVSNIRSPSSCEKIEEGSQEAECEEELRQEKRPSTKPFEA